MRTIDILRAKRLLAKTPTRMPNVGDPISVEWYALIRDSREILQRLCDQAEQGSPVLGGSEPERLEPDEPVDTGPIWVFPPRRNFHEFCDRLRVGMRVRFAEIDENHPCYYSKGQNCATFCRAGRMCTIVGFGRISGRQDRTQLGIVRDGNKSRESFHVNFFEFLLDGQHA